MINKSKIGASLTMRVSDAFFIIGNFWLRFFTVWMVTPLQVQCHGTAGEAEEQEIDVRGGLYQQKSMGFSRLYGGVFDP